MNSKHNTAEIYRLMKVIRERPPISLELLTEALAAMHFCIMPYEKHPDLHDYPHIIELAMAYNKIIYAISPTCRHDFQPFKF